MKTQRWRKKDRFLLEQVNADFKEGPQHLSEVTVDENYYATGEEIGEAENDSRHFPKS